MQQAGYNTYYTGKLWNAHDVNNYNAPYAGGFNGSDILLDPYTYEYFNGKMSRNGGEPVSYKGQYSPDVVAEKAYGFLDEAAMHSEPFFLGIAPIAPHSHISFEPFEVDMPKYHPRHAHLFKDYKIPRTRNFNPKEASIRKICLYPLFHSSLNNPLTAPKNFSTEFWSGLDLYPTSAQ